MVIVDDDDERLVLTAAGEFRAEVIPEDADGAWRTLSGGDDLVEFYDPTDVFGDLADALAEAFPSVAPELRGTTSEASTTTSRRRRRRGRRRLTADDADGRRRCRGRR